MTVTVDMVESEPVAVRLPSDRRARSHRGGPRRQRPDRHQQLQARHALSNGVKTQVPPFVEAGERIVVRTEDGSYVERAKG